MAFVSRPTSPEQAVRSGVVLIRVWLEQDDPCTPRARLTAVTSSDDRRTWAAVGVEQICAEVRSWLLTLTQTARSESV